MRINYDDNRSHNDYYYSDFGGCIGCEHYKYGNSNENCDMHSMHSMHDMYCILK